MLNFGRAAENTILLISMRYMRPNVSRSKSADALCTTRVTTVVVACRSDGIQLNDRTQKRVGRI